MGAPSDKNDKTQLLSDSQVLEVKPSPPARAVEDKHDRSVWKGMVVGADEFAPPAPAASKGPRWLVLAIIALAGLGVGAYFLWPKGAAKVIPDAAAAPAIAPPVDTLPHDAAPDAPADGAIDAPGDAPGDAVVDAAVPDDASLPDATVGDAGVASPAKPKAPVKRKLRPPAKHPVKRTH